MKSKFILLLMTCILLLAPLAACAQQPEAAPQATQAPAASQATQAPAVEQATQAPVVEQATQAPATEVVTQAPAAEQATQAPATEKTKVTIWMAGDDARFMMDSDIPKKFEQQFPQYQAEIVQYPWDGLHDKVVAGFSGGDLPDVFEGADQWVGEFADLGGLQPMDDFKNKMGYKDEDFIPTSWEHFRYVDGVLYAAPFQFESRLLFYRPDLLKAAGLSGPPKNFDELLAYGKKLSNGNDKFGVAHQDQWLDFHFFSYILYGSGGDYYNKDRTECTLTDPAGIDALTFYQKLYNENVIPKDPAKRVETFKGFKEGYYAMAESGAWWFGLLQTQAPELGKIGEGKWEVANLPEGKTTVSYGHPNPWIVPKGAKNLQGAYDWISFFYQPEIGVEWAQTYGQPPTVLKAYDDPVMKNDPRMQALVASANRGTNSIYNVRGADYITQVVWNALADLRDAKSTPDQAAKSVCEQMQQYLFEKK